MAAKLEMNDIRSAATEFGKGYGAERIYLFGSYARGDADSDSDVDLRIDKGQIRGLFALSGLRLALKDRLGVEVDLLTSDILDDEFLDRIRNEEVLLYAGD